MSMKQELVAGVGQRSAQAGTAQSDMHHSSRDSAAGRRQTHSSRPNVPRTRAKNVIPGSTHTSPRNAEEALPPVGTDPNTGTHPMLLP